MSKKKKGATIVEKVVLGRPGNNVKMGIVGMPNVGKSTTFNTLSKLQVAAENFPFCTIDPNVARIPVPDERFDKLCEHHKPPSRISAMLSITDIAGLVKGASEGAGLGNNFLSHISAVDGIFHVLRAFKAKTVEHVEGSVDPIRDYEIINNELRAKDIAVLQSQIEILGKAARVAKLNKSPDMKFKAMQLEVATKAVAGLKEGVDVRSQTWNGKEIDAINSFLCLTAKPQVVLVNIRDKDFQSLKNKWIKPIMTYMNKNAPGTPVIPYSADWETKYLAMEDEEAKAKYIAGFEGKIKSMLPKIIHAGYSALRLFHYFTCGPKEVRCWSIREGTKAPQAAGVIHTDFEKTFVCAEIYSYDNFVEFGSEQAVKSAGKYATKGRDYVVVDGDIMFFKTGASGKKR